MSYPWAPGMRRSVRYSPAIEFARGATGLWLAGGDPAQRYGEVAMAAMYANDRLADAVTAAGTSAGLVLDKSSSFELGPEQITDPDFNDPTKWTANTGWSIADGIATRDGSAGNSAIQQSMPNHGPGLFAYYTEVEIENIVSGTPSLFWDGGYRPMSDPSQYKGARLFTRITTIAGLAGTSGVAYSASRFSARMIAGHHAAQPTAASRPTLRFDADIGKYYWEPDGADFWECNGAAGTLLGDFEIHAAVRWTGNRALVSKMDTSYDAGAGPQGWMVYSNAGRQPVFLYRPPSGGSIAIASPDAIDNGTDLVISAWRKDAVISIAVDGEIVRQVGPAPSTQEEYGNFASNLQLFRTWRGSDGWGNYWNGRLYGDGLVIINNRSLEDSDRRLLIRYLARLQGRSL